MEKKTFANILLSLLPLIQGIYFCVTGIWPVLHIESFMWVTGPKEDIWLVKTVGLAIIAMGLPLIVAAIRKEVNLPIALLGAAAAAAFAWVDFYYYFDGRLKWVYLLDGVAEFGFLIVWVIVWKAVKKSNNLVR